MDASRRQEIALFRYQIIASLVTQNLIRVQYGLLLHELTRQEFNHGDVGERQLGRRTIQRWVQAYRQKGLEGLEPAVRSDKSTPKVVAPAVLDQAIAPRREVPGRSVDQIIAILEFSGKVGRARSSAAP